MGNNPMVLARVIPGCPSRLMVSSLLASQRSRLTASSRLANRHNRLMASSLLASRRSRLTVSSRRLPTVSQASPPPVTLVMPQRLKLVSHMAAASLMAAARVNMVVPVAVANSAVLAGPEWVAMASSLAVRARWRQS